MHVRTCETNADRYSLSNECGVDRLKLSQPDWCTKLLETTPRYDQLQTAN